MERRFISFSVYSNAMKTQKHLLVVEDGEESGINIWRHLLELFEGINFDVVKTENELSKKLSEFEYKIIFVDNSFYDREGDITSVPNEPQPSIDGVKDDPNYLNEIALGMRLSTGEMLAKWMRKMNIQSWIVGMTGYASTDTLMKHHIYNDVIQKPFELDKILFGYQKRLELNTPTISFLEKMVNLGAKKDG